MLKLISLSLLLSLCACTHYVYEGVCMSPGGPIQVEANNVQPRGATLIIDTDEVTILAPADKCFFVSKGK